MLKYGILEGMKGRCGYQIWDMGRSKERWGGYRRWDMGRDGICMVKYGIWEEMEVKGGCGTINVGYEKRGKVDMV